MGIVLRVVDRGVLAGQAVAGLGPDVDARGSLFPAKAAGSQHPLAGRGRGDAGRLVVGTTFRPALVADQVGAVHLHGAGTSGAGSSARSSASFPSMTGMSGPRSGRTFRTSTTYSEARANRLPVATASAGDVAATVTRFGGVFSPPDRIFRWTSNVATSPSGLLRMRLGIGGIGGPLALDFLRGMLHVLGSGVVKVGRASCRARVWNAARRLGAADEGAKFR